MWGGEDICEISPGRLDVTSRDVQTCLAQTRSVQFCAQKHASADQPNPKPLNPEALKP